MQQQEHKVTKVMNWPSALLDISRLEITTVEHKFGLLNSAACIRAALMRKSKINSVYQSNINETQVDTSSSQSFG